MAVGLAMAGMWLGDLPGFSAFIHLYRDLQCPPDQRWPVFLGRHAFNSQEGTLRFVDLWLVQSPWSGRCDHWNKVFSSQRYLWWHAVLTHSRSFGCATFISTVATINTSFVPNEKTTIGVYAAVLISQGASWWIHSF